MITYDTATTADFAMLNGRALADDVIDVALTAVTNGALTSDCVANDSASREPSRTWRPPTDVTPPRAQAKLELRTDVYGYDALAWALFAVGRLDEAAEAAAEATRLGTADPRIAYHGGMIAAATGRTDEARALLERAVAGLASLPPFQVPRAVAALVAIGD